MNRYDMEAMPLHLVAKELGRRVSHGEYERMFSALIEVKIGDRTMKLKTGGYVKVPTFSMSMHTMCPKWMRKHSDTIGVKHSRRARYDVDKNRSDSNAYARSQYKH